MKEETAEARAAFIRLKFFEDRVVGDRDTLARHEQEFRCERQKYSTACPLTEAEREELAQHVEGGGALCCHDGLEWLRARLPEPWAQALNEWAYEALACQGEARQSEYAAKVRALKLDRFPGSGVTS